MHRIITLSTELYRRPTEVILILALYSHKHDKPYNGYILQAYY